MAEEESNQPIVPARVILPIMAVGVVALAIVLAVTGNALGAVSVVIGGAVGFLLLAIKWPRRP